LHSARETQKIPVVLLCDDASAGQIRRLLAAGPTPACPSRSMCTGFATGWRRRFPPGRVSWEAACRLRENRRVRGRLASRCPTLDVSFPSVRSRGSSITKSSEPECGRPGQSGIVHLRRAGEESQRREA
jgi:hypothetical protein